MKHKTNKLTLSLLTVIMVVGLLIVLPMTAYAEEITVGSLSTGFLFTSGSDTWTGSFRVDNAIDNSGVKLWTTFYGDNGGNAFDPFLVLWDSEGNMLALNNDRVYGVFDSYIDFGFLADGTYMFTIGNWPNRPNGAHLSDGFLLAGNSALIPRSNGEWEAHISGVLSCTPDDPWANGDDVMFDNENTGFLFTSGSDTWTGSFVVDNALDNRGVILQTHFFELYYGYAFDPFLVVWDPNGNLIAFNNDKSEWSRDARIDLGVLADGIYTFTIGNHPNAPAGDKFSDGFLFTEPSMLTPEDYGYWRVYISGVLQYPPDDPWANGDDLMFDNENTGFLFTSGSDTWTGTFVVDNALDNRGVILQTHFFELYYGYAFDPFLVVWDSNGNLIALNNDKSEWSRDARIDLGVLADGIYTFTIGNHPNAPAGDKFSDGFLITEPSMLTPEDYGYWRVYISGVLPYLPDDPWAVGDDLVFDNENTGFLFTSGADTWTGSFMVDNALDNRGVILRTTFYSDNGGNAFDPFLVLWDSNGYMLALNNDRAYGVFDSYIDFGFLADGTYMFTIGNWPNQPNGAYLSDGFLLAGNTALIPGGNGEWKVYISGVLPYLPAGPCADGHDFIDDPTGKDYVAPTCTEPGVMPTKCSVCGESGPSHALPATGHDYLMTEKVDATCEADGYELWVCQNDAEHFYTVDLKATGHDYLMTEKVDATCEAAGYELWVCQNDAEHFYTVDLFAMGHDYLMTEKVDATCEADGYELWVCQNDAEHFYTVDLTATGHDWDKGVVTVKPTAHAEGTKVFTCKNCGETDSVTLPKLIVNGVSADASVEKLNGNKNNLTITVTELVSKAGSEKQSEVTYTMTFSIDNNAAGIYKVGPYQVYVNTKGNTQIREIYIVE